MSVATRIAPGELAELDPDMWDELERAAGEHWSTERELAAKLYELVSAWFVVYVRAHTKRPPAGLEPVTVPRPAWVLERPPAERERPRRLSVAELVAQTGVRAVNVGGAAGG